MATGATPRWDDIVTAADYIFAAAAILAGSACVALCGCCVAAYRRIRFVEDQAARDRLEARTTIADQDETILLCGELNFRLETRCVALEHRLGIRESDQP